MKLRISRDWVRRMTSSEIEEPGGILACSPEIYAEMLEARRRSLESIDREKAEQQTGFEEG